MSLGSFISSLLKKAPQPERAKEPERIALSKIEKDIDELEAALHASEAETLPVTDDAFLPDAKVIKELDYSHVDTARENHPPELVDTYLQHGYIVQSSPEFDLPRARVDLLRKILASKGLDTVGKKPELVSRIQENFSAEELKAFPFKSRYFVTPAGKKVVDFCSATESRKRLYRAIELTRPIAHGDLQTASEMLRPSPTSTSGMQDWPEGIWRYINDVGCDDGVLLVAIVETRFMAYPKTVRTDLEHFGYHIDEDDIIYGFTGSGSYYEVLLAEKLGCLYKIKACSCPYCNKMDGKVFSPSEAKVGVTLPPFSKQCRCLVMLENKEAK